MVIDIQGTIIRISYPFIDKPQTPYQKGKFRNIMCKIFGILVIFDNEMTYKSTLNEEIYKNT